MRVRSMTGFARVRKTGAAGEAVVTVKSVNHRALDLHVHLPDECEVLDPKIRELGKKHTSRGHVDIRVSFRPADGAAAAALNRPLFEAWLRAARTAASEYGLKPEPDVNAALRIPGMLGGGEDAETPAEVESLVLETVEEALAALNEFREREGTSLVALMRASAEAIQRSAEGIAALRDQVTPYLRARLEERLEELLGKNSIAPERLAQEAVLVADRSDIAEEIGRLGVHAGELLEILERGGEIGKKLDFLLQEMNRETNTILSKTSGAGELGLRITSLGLEAKSAIERVREQALNIE
jgi:uncharacterized protein (TIGR00255 family)